MLPRLFLIRSVQIAPIPDACSAREVTTKTTLSACEYSSFETPDIFAFIRPPSSRLLASFKSLVQPPHLLPLLHPHLRTEDPDLLNEGTYYCKQQTRRHSDDPPSDHPFLSRQDRDGSGYVSRQELREMLREQGRGDPGRIEATVEATIHQYDLDRGSLHPTPNPTLTTQPPTSTVALWD